MDKEKKPKLDKKHLEKIKQLKEQAKSEGKIIRK